MAWRMSSRVAVLKRTPNICKDPSPKRVASGAGAVFKGAGVEAAMLDRAAGAELGGTAVVPRHPVCADTCTVKAKLQPQKTLGVARNSRKTTGLFKNERVAERM